MSAISAYATTVAKLKATKVRINKLQTTIVAECDNYDMLFGQLQVDLGEQIGQSITLIPEGMNTHRPKIMEVIFKRIQALRHQEQTFDYISTRLNVEGFKTADGIPFTSQAARLFFEEMRNK